MMKLFLSILIVWSAFLPFAWSYCFASTNSCYDPVTNESMEAGDTWNTSNCHSCSCISYQEPVATCFVPEDIPDNTGRQGKKDHSTDSENSEIEEEDNGWSNASEIPVIEKVIISNEEATDFVCPELPTVSLDPVKKEFIFSILKQVTYFTKVISMECCSRYFTPIGIDEELCEAKWYPEECQYKILDKKTGEPCEAPFALVGK